MKSLVLSLAAFTLGIGTPHGAFAQEIPKLDNGQPYAKQRQRILAKGWVMVTDRNRSCTRFPEAYRAACRAYPELDRCGGDDNCSLYWRGKDGNYLQIFAYGEHLEVLGYAHPAFYRGKSGSPGN